MTGGGGDALTGGGGDALTGGGGDSLTGGGGDVLTGGGGDSLTGGGGDSLTGGGGDALTGGGKESPSGGGGAAGGGVGSTSKSAAHGTVVACIAREALVCAPATRSCPAGAVASRTTQTARRPGYQVLRSEAHDAGRGRCRRRPHAWVRSATVLGACAAGGCSREWGKGVIGCGWRQTRTDAQGRWC